MLHTGKNDGEGFDLILFGARGDLARRKLLPSLFALYACGSLPSRWRLLGVSRTDMTTQSFQQVLYEQIAGMPSLAPSLDCFWQGFAGHLHYQALDATEPTAMKGLDSPGEAHWRRIFYLATRGDLFAVIAGNLQQAGLVDERARIVLEKPVGLDLDSARHISGVLLEVFREQQIYRIDHYLGKDTVQNLLVLRFANTLFENQWNHRYIDHIQITISENEGVTGRGSFYDSVGALRDMVQNHLLQLLCMTAMEPPHRMEAEAVRDEKVKVLRALRRMDHAALAEKLVRGQYRPGAGVEKGYLEEEDVAAGSRTETFVAMKVEIDNWRWAGVPFYLRTGKRLARRACEIVVHFKSVPHSIFRDQHRAGMANRLVFRLQPDEGVRLSLCEKRPGEGMSVRSSALSLTDDSAPGERVPEAYERLLKELIDGNQTLFVRDDELMAAWQWLDPVIRHWRSDPQPPEPYDAGSWGPSAADLMLARDGRGWDEPSGSGPVPDEIDPSGEGADASGD